MIRKIVVATDGSNVARKAVAYAGELARQLGASLTLLSVVDAGSFVGLGVAPEVSPRGIQESTEDLLRNATQAYLDEALSDSRLGEVNVSKTIRSGHPVEEIVKGAEAENADLLILGSHGRSALKAAVLGSVAYGVLHKDTAIPVLIVRR
jgi:nucleotide-binding universal stress UspA family protein